MHYHWLHIWFWLSKILTLQGEKGKLPSFFFSSLGVGGIWEYFWEEIPPVWGKTKHWKFFHYCLLNESFKTFHKKKMQLILQSCFCYISLFFFIVRGPEIWGREVWGATCPSLARLGYAFAPEHPCWFGALFTFKTLFLSSSREIKLFWERSLQNDPFWANLRKDLTDQTCSSEILSKTQKILVE